MYNIIKHAGTVLGQAQLKLELTLCYTSDLLHQIDYTIKIVLIEWINFAH